MRMKQLYNFKEAYRNVYLAIPAFHKLKKALATGVINQQFKERIMLAVTQVNGCAMCSYAHTQMALESGMSREEINQMLSGESTNLAADEAFAVVFAQHYADSRGNPSKEAWERLNEMIGKEKSRAVLSVIHVIMAGNTYGIPLGSLKGRLTHRIKEIDSRSTFIYEILMLLSIIVYLPVAFIHTRISFNENVIL